MQKKIIVNKCGICNKPYGAYFLDCIATPV